MKKWIENILRQIAIKIGVQPILRYVISLLKDKAIQTKNIYDDEGVLLLEKINDSGQYDVINITKLTLERLREIAKSTENQIDDKAVEMLIRVINSNKITLETLFDEMVVEIENYARTTETPFDDVIPIALKEIKKEIF